MSDGSSYADILILALIAGFILLRLRSVLGDKIGNDNPSYFNKPQASEPVKAEPIVQLDEKSLRPRLREEEDPYLASLSDSAMTAALEEMKEKDPQFTATAFLQGAKMAYEMVFDAFAKGDKKTLSMLLSSELYDTFAREIDSRDGSAQKADTTLVSVTAKSISEASVNGSIARIKVVFDSEQITVVRNDNGEIIEGNPSDVTQVEEDWVFERNVTSKNPNWKVIET
jgi:predicted lipid-binding transport protein (Tim44 family)